MKEESCIAFKGAALDNLSKLKQSDLPPNRVKRKNNCSKYYKTICITQQIQKGGMNGQTGERLKRITIVVLKTCLPKSFSEFVFVVFSGALAREAREAQHHG